MEDIQRLFEDLLLEAIEELKSVKNSVDDHRIVKKISAIESDLQKALKYSEKGDYLKAFLRNRHATHIIEKLIKHRKLGESLKDELKNIAQKLALAVQYKVEESLESAKGLEGSRKSKKLNKAWKFYDRGTHDLKNGRYSKAISRFIVAYRLLRTIVHHKK